MHVNGEHQLCVGRRNGDGQMVDHHWHFGFAADSTVVYAHRRHCICHTKLAWLTVDCVIALVRITLVLVSVTRQFYRLHLIGRWKYVIIIRCRNHRYFLPESPRWLLTKGRINELKEIIETAAKWNNRKLPKNYEKILIPPGKELSSGSFADLFKGDYLRTTLMLIIAWYTLALQYMAMTLHIGEMGGNIYVITVTIFKYIIDIKNLQFFVQLSCVPFRFADLCRIDGKHCHFTVHLHCAAVRHSTEYLLFGFNCGHLLFVHRTFSEHRMERRRYNGNAG